MRQKSVPTKEAADRVIKGIRRATRRHFSAEDKIRIALEGLRGEASIAELCRREGIVENLYYRWSKEFLEVGWSQVHPGDGRLQPDPPAQADRGVGVNQLPPDSPALPASTKRRKANEALTTGISAALLV